MMIAPSRDGLRTITKWKIEVLGGLEGPYAWWHPNGQLRAEGNYKEGKKEGIWIMYDSFGKEEECLTYANGESTD